MMTCSMNLSNEHKKNVAYIGLVEIFSEKTSKKKHLCRHDKNYYYFCKSNIPVINLIVGSRNMIKVSKNVSL